MENENSEKYLDSKKKVAEFMSKDDYSEFTEEERMVIEDTLTDCLMRWYDDKYDLETNLKYAQGIAIANIDLSRRELAEKICEETGAKGYGFVNVKGEERG